MEEAWRERTIGAGAAEMAAKKFYAVRKGRKTGIFSLWNECRTSVAGYKGAEYKGFATLAEAEEFMEIGMKQGDAPSGKKGSKAEEKEDPADIIPDSPDKMIAYVDGSYDHSLKKYAFGCVFLLPDGSIYVENGNGDNPESLALRNVTGEMLGAMFAVRFAMVNGYRKIELRYDYEGIEKWVTGVWKSKTDLTQKYAKAMRGWNTSVEITFTKVAAHTNVYYNELADQLAKGALRTGKGVPEVRKKEAMELWTGDER